MTRTATTMTSATVLRQSTDHPHPAVAKIIDALASMSGSRIPQGRMPACWACGSKLDVKCTEPGHYSAECKSCTWWAVGMEDAGTDDDGRKKFNVMFSQTFYGVTADAPDGRRERVKKDAGGVK